MPEQTSGWQARAYYAALSPTGDSLAIAHLDGMVRVWHIPWDKFR